MEWYWEGHKYENRSEAGLVLARKLRLYRWRRPMVLAIPNGGVAVGLPVARELNCPLHLIVVRKLQIPDQPEAGFGAVTSDGNVLLNESLISRLDLSHEVIERQKKRALKSIQERLTLYGERAEFPDIEGHVVILVDDGLASGFTMKAAVMATKKHKPGRLVIAVPTSSMRAYRDLSPLVDEWVCPDVSRLPVFAVADAYRDWYDLEDGEVIALLNEHLGS